jgi:hypothetical protein
MPEHKCFDMLGLGIAERLLAQQSIMPRQLNLCQRQGLELHQFVLAQCCAVRGSSHRINGAFGCSSSSFFDDHDSLMPDNCLHFPRPQIEV